VVKSPGEEGSPKCALCITGGIKGEELLGVISIEVDLLKRDMLNDRNDESR
jgi:hypothetical protein